MKTFLIRAVRYLRDTRAVSALEYAILVGVVSVALLGAFTAFNADIQAAISKIGANVGETTKNTGK